MRFAASPASIFSPTMFVVATRARGESRCRDRRSALARCSFAARGRVCSMHEEERKKEDEEKEREEEAEPTGNCRRDRLERRPLARPLVPFLLWPTSARRPSLFSSSLRTSSPPCLYFAFDSWQRSRQLRTDRSIPAVGSSIEIAPVRIVTRREKKMRER